MRSAEAHSQAVLGIGSKVVSALSKIAGIAVGVSAIAYVIGSIYLRSFYNELGASWVFDSLPVASILRTASVAMTTIGFVLIMNWSLAALPFSTPAVFALSAFSTLVISAITIFNLPADTCSDEIKVVALALALPLVASFVLIAWFRVKHWNAMLVVVALISCIAITQLIVSLSGKSRARQVIKTKGADLPAVVLSNCVTACDGWLLVKSMGERALLSRPVANGELGMFRLVDWSDVSSVSRTPEDQIRLCPAKDG